MSNTKAIIVNTSTGISAQCIGVDLDAPRPKNEIVIASRSKVLGDYVWTFMPPLVFSNPAEVFMMLSALMTHFGVGDSRNHRARYIGVEHTAVSMIKTYLHNCLNGLEGIPAQYANVAIQTLEKEGIIIDYTTKVWRLEVDGDDDGGDRFFDKAIKSEDSAMLAALIYADITDRDASRSDLIHQQTMKAINGIKGHYMRGGSGTEPFHFLRNLTA